MYIFVALNVKCKKYKKKKINKKFWSFHFIIGLLKNNETSHFRKIWKILLKTFFIFENIVNFLGSLKKYTKN